MDTEGFPDTDLSAINVTCVSMDKNALLEVDFELNWIWNRHRHTYNLLAVVNVILKSPPVAIMDYLQFEYFPLGTWQPFCPY
jgi:hypothetical protein